jgi:hypothetical protein
MNNDNYLDVFNDQQKAIDHAMWLNFKYRIANIVFGVIHGSNNNWAVCEQATADEIGFSFLKVLPKDYIKLTYKQLDKIRQDEDPLPHWETIVGMLAVMDGEILRFILKNQLPLDRMIRHELALRGFDKNHRWCGFDKARDVWLNDK